jgi:hypothetical protein
MAWHAAWFRRPRKEDRMKCGLSRRRFLDRLSALSGGAAAAWISFEAVRCAPPVARRAICRADVLAVGGLECPCHGGAYAVADGRVLHGPPPRGLERLRLEREDGYIVVTGLAA